MTEHQLRTIQTATESISVWDLTDHGELWLLILWALTYLLTAHLFLYPWVLTLAVKSPFGVAVSDMELNDRICPTSKLVSISSHCIVSGHGARQAVTTDRLQSNCRVFVLRDFGPSWRHRSPCINCRVVMTRRPRRPRYAMDIRLIPDQSCAPIFERKSIAIDRRWCRKWSLMTARCRSSQHRFEFVRT